MNLETKSLLARLPKCYHERVRLLEREDGLIDNCKFMLYFADGWNWCQETSTPVLSITEAVRFVKEAERE